MRAVTTAVVCTLAMAAGGACGRGGSGGGPGGDKDGGHGFVHTPRHRMVLIVLSLKPTGAGGARQCDYDAPNARAYSREPVTFRIVNRCDATQEIDLDFAKSSPFQEAPPYRVSAEPGATSETLQVTVRDHGPITSTVTYSYGIKLNGQPGKDPAFEVDPF